MCTSLHASSNCWSNCHEKLAGAIYIYIRKSGYGWTLSRISNASFSQLLSSFSRALLLTGQRTDKCPRSLNETKAIEIILLQKLMCSCYLAQLHWNESQAENKDECKVQCIKNVLLNPALAKRYQYPTNEQMGGWDGSTFCNTSKLDTSTKLFIQGSLYFTSPWSVIPWAKHKENLVNDTSV